MVSLLLTKWRVHPNLHSILPRTHQMYHEFLSENQHICVCVTMSTVQHINCYIQISICFYDNVYDYWKFCTCIHIYIYVYLCMCLCAICNIMRDWTPGAHIRTTIQFCHFWQYPVQFDWHNAYVHIRIIILNNINTNHTHTHTHEHNRICTSTYYMNMHIYLYIYPISLYLP